jgi:hypothetical protein
MLRPTALAMIRALSMVRPRCPLKIRDRCDNAMPVSLDSAQRLTPGAKVRSVAGVDALMYWCVTLGRRACRAISQAYHSALHIVNRATRHGLAIDSLPNRAVRCGRG